MTDIADTPLPEQHDGEPDLQAEVARLNAELAELTKQMPSADDLAELTRNLGPSASEYDALIASLRDLVTEDEAANAPKDASRLDTVMWFVGRAAEQAKRPKVPATDTTKPALGAVEPDLSTLPPHARIARGYRA